MQASTRLTWTVAPLVVTAIALAAPAAAQDEGTLRAAFEGRRVTLKIDMPGTSDGVDVRPESRRGIDYADYGGSLKRFGTAIHTGDSVTVTLVKVKKDLIEFQLAGGGFGTFGDDTSTSVYMPLKDKSEREKDLEKLVRDEPDRERRHRYERELGDLRDRRERENRRIEFEKERAEEVKRERVAHSRLHGGSRFNIRYDDRVPSGMRPEDVKAVLLDYVDFGDGEGFRTMPGPPPPMPSDPRLRKGMSRVEAERALGMAIEVAQRRQGDLSITTLVFLSGDEKISADFVEDVLVKYTISSK
ncbi:MAG TPA: hypothetical protein VKH42_03935 [Vicinamibacterales bacterium]|nr:hypothetical protein [Vicinamibacterales bacterium]